MRAEVAAAVAGFVWRPGGEGARGVPEGLDDGARAVRRYARWRATFCGGVGAVTGMNGPGRIGGAGAHGAYHEQHRCPICVVPPLAPHMDSCDYEGIWRGDLPSGAEDEDED